MSAPQAVSEAVSQHLVDFVAARRGAALSDSAEAAFLIDAADASLSGGKRLRARFAETGWRAVGGPAGAPEILDVAASLELFQAAALVHDDIIDNSDTRRGRPAAHRALEAMHRQNAWAGDAEAFGRSAAILLGDLLLAWSDDLFEDGLARTASPAFARAEYTRMRRDVTLGQFLDIAQESAWVRQPASEHAARALEIASLKSARYSVQQPIVIGAALADATDAQADALRAFGLPIGLAFQLRDDVLGVFGDEAVTGKPAGDDLREGKRTVLVAYTRETLDDAERARLDAALGDVDLDDAAVASIQRLMRSSGAVDRVEGLIADYAREADRALAEPTLDAAAVADLRALAVAAVDRTA